MNEQQHNKREPIKVSTIAGILLIVAGLLVFMNNFGIWRIRWHDVFTWQVVLMVVGLFMLCSPDSRRAGWTLFFVGAFFWAFRFVDLSETLRKLLWPVGLMVGGLALMVGHRRSHHSYEQPIGAAPSNNGSTTPPPHDNANGAMYLDYSAVIASRRFTPVAQSIAGGEVRCAMGQALVNLSQTTLNSPSVRLRISCTLGGCTLIVPTGWRVQLDVNPIMGSASDLRLSSPPDNGPLLIVEGQIFMGSCRIEQP